MKNYTKDIDEGHFLEVDVQYLEKLHELHNDLPFLSKRIGIEKVEKLIASLYHKTEHVIQIRNLKQPLNTWISFKKSS